jgi:hypothetical protein
MAKETKLLTITHKDLSDEQFLKRFEELNIEPSLFTHEAHVRLSWIYFNKTRDFQRGLEMISNGIRKFDIEFSGGIKYHHTITTAFAMIIYSRMNKFEEAWIDFINRNTDLLQSKSLLSKYYSDDILNSQEAEIKFLKPDKLTLKI